MNYLSQQNPADFHGKRVILRLDLNVPLNDAGHVDSTDADRIMKSLPTLKWLADAGAKTIVISHIGRDPKETLRPVARYMESVTTIGFDPELSGERLNEMIANMGNGHALLLENLRSNSGEESNDEAFAKSIADLGDIYVNDAFAVSHRAHASVVGIPKLLPHFAGLQMEQEIEHLSKSFSPSSPSILVLGGAKFETKLPVIQKFLGIVDHIVIGGALANNFYKAMGYDVGSSLIDETANVSGLLGNPKIIIPETVIVENEKGKEEKKVSDVARGDKIVDIAPSGLDLHADLFKNAAFVLWNGPMGNYENGFVDGSKKIVELIADSQAESIVGGGDSVALVEELDMSEKFGFLSTGGGAMLEYLAQGTLPGIEALR
ncbi:MAG: Phosphoglycerate kinase [Patescibacteria group bacterium]|nr:Phosphoglycerate kinase [Patescibacteria group bacterium]